MTVLEFIDLLNVLINPTQDENMNMQVIPVHNFEEIPPVPFATYDIYDSYSDIAKEDTRNILGNKIIEYATEREEVKIRFKVYSYNHIQAYKEFKKLLHNIIFVWRDRLVKSHVSILDYKEEGQRTERLEEGYIYAYSFSLTIGINTVIEREINKLETVIVELNNKYNIEQKFNEKNK